MGQGRFRVPLRGRKHEWYLMKGCVKDFLNLLDTSRERVAFMIFCVFLFFFFRTTALTWKGGWLENNYIKCVLYLLYEKLLHFTIDIFSKHFWLKTNFISWFENKKTWLMPYTSNSTGIMGKFQDGDLVAWWVLQSSRQIFTLWTPFFLKYHNLKAFKRRKHHFESIFLRSVNKNLQTF